MTRQNLELFVILVYINSIWHDPSLASNTQILLLKETPALVLAGLLAPFRHRGKAQGASLEDVIDNDRNLY